MNRFIQRMPLAFVLAFLPSQNICLASYMHVDTPPGSHTDNFDSVAGPGFVDGTFFTGMERVPYVTPPNVDPSSTNLYGMSSSGQAGQFFMDEPWGSRSIFQVEFDWVSLDSSRLVVSTTYRPIWTTEFSAIFSQLPPATPEYVSVPETRRVSFGMSCPGCSGDSGYFDLSLQFFATNSSGEAAAFGLDNFKISVVPEPNSAASLILMVLTILGARGWK